MTKKPSFETALPGQRFVWAMQLVHIPEEGLTPAQFFIRAGRFAGLKPGVVVELIKLFHTRHGRNKRIMRGSVERKTS